MVRRRLWAGALVTLALAAYVFFSQYADKNYIHPVKVETCDQAGGRTGKSGTTSGGEMNFKSNGSLMDKRAWNPFHRRLRPDLPRILFWTKIYGDWFSDLDVGDPELQTTDCPDRCYITNDRRTLNISDAVVFYAHDLIPSLMPEQRSPFQKWVFWSLEPPWHTPVETFSGLKETFNWTFTYRMDSDILDTYGEVSVQEPGREVYSNGILRRLWQKKSRMAAWAVSSCNTSGKREEYVRELQKYMLVDVYGECGDYECPRSKEEDCYQLFASHYFFYLSFENCICKDYVTEKFFKVLNYDIVPVVFGGANYSRVAPPGSFIDVLSFRSPKHLALYLEKVANSFSLYSRYFQWKSKYEVWNWTYYTFCALCHKLYSESFRTKSLVPDLLHWWNTSSHCRAFNGDTKTFYE